MRPGMVLAAVAAASTGAYAATWTPMTQPAPLGSGTMTLLSDGTVLMQGDARWQRLTPSADGSYRNGTWSLTAPMSEFRLYFGSNVLTDGRFLVLGGEDAGNFDPVTQQWADPQSRTGEIYDPVADSWSAIAPHPEANFGDDPTMLLDHGKILAGSIITNNSYLYDIATNTWSTTIPKANADRSDEESWVKLPNGKVVTYDMWLSLSTGGQYAEMFDPVLGSWQSISPSDGTAHGSIPALTNSGQELGALLLLRGGVRGHGSQKGEVFALGATGHTAHYHVDTNTWDAGPDIIGTLNGQPTLFGADDAPAAILPDGRVLLAADAGPQVQGYLPPTQLFVYDPVRDTMAPATPDIPASSGLANQFAFTTRMLMLPTGEVLFSAGSRQLWIYTPDGHAPAGSEPSVGDVAYLGNGEFKLSGRRLTGISAGSAYGDDSESDENFPVIRLTDSTGTVRYARTYDWSSTGVAVATRESVRFRLNPATGPGQYALEVVAAGIASKEVCVSIKASDVAAIPGTRTHESECGE